MRTNLDADNVIAFDKNNYKNEEDFQKDVGLLMDKLTKLGYMCSFRHEDVGIYILGFDHDNPDFGSPRVYWLDSDQVDCLYSTDHINEDDDEKICCCCKDVG